MYGDSSTVTILLSLTRLTGGKRDASDPVEEEVTGVQLSMPYGEATPLQLTEEGSLNERGPPPAT